MRTQNFNTGEILIHTASTPLHTCKATHETERKETHEIDDTQRSFASHTLEEVDTQL
jgi:hypothetical protein